MQGDITSQGKVLKLRNSLTSRTVRFRGDNFLPPTIRLNHVVSLYSDQSDCQNCEHHYFREPVVWIGGKNKKLLEILLWYILL